jgi:hypothetical protein
MREPVRWGAAHFLQRLCGRPLISQSNFYAAAHTLRVAEAKELPQQQGKTSMTTLVLENLAALPAQVQSLRMLLARLARALDALVSARAARSVSEWQMRQAQSEIARINGLIQDGGKRRPVARDNKAKSTGESTRSESAICNFGR